MHLPLPDAGYDAVVSQEALLHVPDIARAFAEAYRVLRRGGRLEVVEGLGGTGPLAKPMVRPSGYDAATSLERGGFKPVRVLAEVTNFRFVEGLKV